MSLQQNSPETRPLGSHDHSPARRVYFRLALAALAAFITLLIALPGTIVHGQENGVQQKYKLKAAGSLQVLENEAEFKTKLTDAKRLHKQLSYSIMQQKGTMSPQQFQQNLKNLKNEVDQMRALINQTNQQMNMLPRFRGRLSSTYAQEQYNELMLYRNQLQMQVTQESAWLNQLQSQKADPKAKDNIDADVHDRREAYHQALQDLRTLADATTQKYDELEKDPEVKKGIEALGKGKRDKPRLGPSHEFLNNVKTLDKLEKADSSSEGDPFQEKPARRSRSKTKAKTKATGSSTEPAGKPGEG